MESAFPPYAPFVAAATGFVLLILAYRRIWRQSAAGADLIEKARNRIAAGFATGVYFLVGGVLLVLSVFIFNEKYGVAGLGLAAGIFLCVAWLLYRMGVWRARFKNWIYSRLRTSKKLKASAPENWALAAVAPLAQVNGQDFHTLAGMEINDFNQRVARKKLAAEWETPDEESFQDLLDWLFETGHRKEFDAFIERIASLAESARDIYLERLHAGEEGITDAQEIEETAHRVAMIRSQETALREGGFLAWDLLRFIDLCRWGHLAGYQGEEETRQRMSAAAQALRSRYESWESMAANYLTGMEFWSVVELRREGPILRKAFDKFLNAKQGPWQLAAWESASAS